MPHNPWASKEDAGFLRAVGVRDDAELVMQPEDWSVLASQLARDLEASEKELREAREAYRELETENGRVRRVAAERVRYAFRERRIALAIAWAGGLMVLAMGVLEVIR
jgi:hypothetical protein